MGQTATGAESDVRKRAYYYSINVIQYIDRLPLDATGTIIVKQLIRSATSVGANLVEAKGASSRKDFVNFYSYSLKSANETLYWLGLLRDAKRLNDETLTMLIEEAKELSKMVGACVVSLKKNGQ
ncbi:MAG: four helix bundle protein [Phycisphaerae bacterium]|jgi:four helix bundle protein|nr:four helix bundle protein [Phycisphaerae bacterium]